MPINIEDIKRSPEYIALSEKVNKVSLEVRKLEGQKQYYQAQQLMLARLRSSYNLDDSPANKKITGKEIADKEKFIKTLKTPKQCDIELKEKTIELANLQKEYNTITIELEPLHVKAVVKYVDDKGTEIRQGGNDTWYLYYSQTAESNTKITPDENNIPTEIEAWQVNSDTEGNVLRTKQKIIVTDKFPEKPKRQHKPHLIFKNLHEPTKIEPLPSPLLSKQTKENLDKKPNKKPKQCVDGFLKRLLK